MKFFFSISSLLLAMLLFQGCSKTDELDKAGSDANQEIDISSDFQYSFILNTTQENGIHNGASILNEAGYSGTRTDSISLVSWDSRFFNPVSDFNIIKISLGVQSFASYSPTVEEFEEFFAIGPRSIIGNPNIEISIQDSEGLEYSSLDGPQEFDKFEIVDVQSQFSSFGFQYLKVNLAIDSLLLYNGNSEEDPILMRDAHLVSLFTFQQ